MGNNIKKFTDEEMATLRGNPYTYKVTRCQLHFTAEFKKKFWDEYSNGKLTGDILKECGYDPEMLGTKRVWGIQLYICRTGRDGGEFHTGTRISTAAQTGEASGNEVSSSQDEMKQLRSKVEYLSQEVDFLKKLFSARTSAKQENS